MKHESAVCQLSHSDRQTDGHGARFSLGKRMPQSRSLLVPLSPPLLRLAHYLQIDYYILLCCTALSGLFIVRDSINIRCPDSRVIARTWLCNKTNEGAYRSAQTTRTQVSRIISF
jgi:hypothetical protein